MTEILSLKYGLYKKIGKEADELIAALPSRYIFPSGIFFHPISSALLLYLYLPLFRT